MRGIAVQFWIRRKRLACRDYYANGLVTNNERDPESGLATGMWAQRQRTSLTMSDDGYLAASTSRAAAHREFTYDSGGLLQSYRKPNQAVTTFCYDESGRIVSEQMPGGFRDPDANRTHAQTRTSQCGVANFGHRSHAEHSIATDVSGNENEST